MLSPYTGYIQSATTGRPIAHATVRVVASGTNTLAQLYSDKPGQSHLDNPTQTNADGLLSFFALPGTYDFLISGTAIATQNVPNILLPIDPSDSAAPVTQDQLNTALQNMHTQLLGDVVLSVNSVGPDTSGNLIVSPFQNAVPVGEFMIVGNQFPRKTQIDAGHNSDVLSGYGIYKDFQTRGAQGNAIADDTFSRAPRCSFVNDSSDANWVGYTGGAPRIFPHSDDLHASGGFYYRTRFSLKNIHISARFFLGLINSGGDANSIFGASNADSNAISARRFGLFKSSNLSGYSFLLTNTAGEVVTLPIPDDHILLAAYNAPLDLVIYSPPFDTNSLTFVLTPQENNSDYPPFMHKFTDPDVLPIAGQPLTPIGACSRAASSSASFDFYFMYLETYQ